MYQYFLNEEAKVVKPLSKLIAIILAFLFVISSGISSNAQSLDKEPTHKEPVKYIEHGKTIKIDVPLAFGYKMSEKKYSVTVSDKKILSVKKVRNTVVVKGKRTGTAKVILKCGKTKKTLKYSVAPKGFSLRAPRVSVQSNIYSEDGSIRYDSISWTKVKGATGYKVYAQVPGTSSGRKPVCIKTIENSNVTSLSVEVNANDSLRYARYHVQAYRKYKGKIYYGIAGVNFSVLE